jgi:hypothetical protein
MTAALPYRWFVNIAALQEKRAFSVWTVLLFSVFVASGRFLGEWALGGHENPLYFSDLLMFVGFYWNCFFVYTLVLRIVLPGQPWQKSMNVILVGIFLGIFPPAIDALTSGIGGFRYGFLWSFPADFSPLLYNPAARVPLGESVTLWMTIAFTGLYVWLRSRDLWRGVIGAGLAWGAAVFNGALLPTGIALLEQALGFSTEHRMFLLSLAYAFVPLAIYLGFNPRLGLGLARRMLHALPFVLIALAGAAYLGPLPNEAAIYALIVAAAFAVALAQNDWHDRDEDAAQGRALYLAAADTYFLNVTGLAVALCLLAGGSMTGVLVLVILTVSFLYSYPFYKAKRYFPANLKIEGVWGASALLVGLVMQTENAAFHGPAWYLAGLPPGVRLAPLAPQSVGAVLLVFGGYSLIAALKDHKDRDADLAAGVQTWYTLAARRGWNEARLHAVLTACACLALWLPFPLLAWAGRLPAVSAALGVPAAAATGVLLLGAAPRRGFTLALGAISLQLLLLTVWLGLTA